jgi:23S rRNA pseudouridine1911/1915/1917 synthase
MALVVGNPPAKGTIEDPVAHHERKKKKMVVSKSGRPAETKFKVAKRFGKKYALLSVEIRTGVRHQIRVHLASAGFPIAGDKLYQNPKKRAEDTLPLKRHFLHASTLGFKHPKTNKWTEFSSDLPKELKRLTAAPPFPYQDHSTRR